MDEVTLNTLNNILTEWANKFGTTIEKLIPEMQKYYIVKYTVIDIAMLIIFAAVIGVGIWLIKKHEKLEKDGRDYNDLHVYGYTMLPFSLIPFIFVCYFTIILFQWIVSPQAALLDKILSTVLRR